jgi:predicted dehydrogenase
MDQLKIGVVGVGHMGRYHAQVYRQLKGVSLAGVADVDPKRAKSVASACRTDAFVDYHDLLEKVDAVSIAAPTTSHCDIARDFLEKGVDVLVEKPICRTVAQAEELTDLAKRKGRVLQVGHTERFNPAVVALKELVDHPRFIESHRIGSFPDRSTDVDVILDIMIHDIDIILNLVGAPVSEVRAVGVPLASDHVDISNTRLEFENGCVANITSSRVSLKQMRKIRLFQKDTYLSLDFTKKELIRVTLDSSRKSYIPKVPFKVHREKIKVDKQANPLKQELEAFCDAVRHRTAPVVSGEDGTEALRVATRINQAIQQNISRYILEEIPKKSV